MKSRGRHSGALKALLEGNFKSEQLRCTKWHVTSMERAKVNKFYNRKRKLVKERLGGTSLVSDNRWPRVCSERRNGTNKYVFSTHRKKTYAAVAKTQSVELRRGSISRRCIHCWSHTGHTGHLRNAHKTDKALTATAMDPDERRAAFQARDHGGWQFASFRLREKRQLHDARTTSDRLRLSRLASRCYQCRRRRARPSPFAFVATRTRHRHHPHYHWRARLALRPTTHLAQSPSATEFSRSDGRAQTNSTNFSFGKWEELSNRSILSISRSR